jgi:ABC-type glycerol-3-phosphate transport system substrate-binding protein
MVCTVTEHRPSWREVFYGPYHPEWFEWLTTGNFPPSDDSSDQDESEMLSLADTQPVPTDIFDQLIRLLEKARE